MRYLKAIMAIMALIIAVPAAADSISIAGIKVGLPDAPLHSVEAVQAISLSLDKQFPNQVPTANIAHSGIGAKSLIQRLYDALLSLNLTYNVKTIGPTTFVVCDNHDFGLVAPNVFGRVKLEVEVSEASGLPPLKLRYTIEEKRLKSAQWRSSNNLRLSTLTTDLVSVLVKRLETK